jgi:hypothetical protein
MALPIEDLKWRIYNVFPAGELALDHLLGLFSVSYSTKIPTAAVQTRLPPKLLFNRQFVDEHCRTDEHLLMLLMHEMYHLVLGHTRLFPLVTPAHNFAFDAVINAMICNSMPGYEYVSFFTNLYLEEGIEALLRPPALWSLEREDRARWKLQGDLLEAHRALYTEEGDLTYRDIFDLVVTRIKSDAEVSLLGNHEKMQTQDAIGDPGIVKAVAEIVGKWPAFEPSGGRDRGSDVAERVVELTRPRVSISRTIKEAITKIAAHGSGPQPIFTTADSETLFPYPTIPDRRASVMQYLGQSPIFFKGQAPRLCRESVGRVHVYLDVSGSMDSFLETIFSCLKPIQNMLYPQIHVFSTEVIDYPIKDILQGFYASTSGTEINCVLEHIIKNKIRKAAIVTDGYVGEPSALLIEQLPERIKLVKLLTPGFYEDDLNHLPGAVQRLPLEEENA